MSSGKPLPDWDRLSFGFLDTDAMYRCIGRDGENPVWGAGEYVPFGPVELSPAAACLGYGIGVFEGLKAQMSRDGIVRLFRIDDHARRFR